MTDRAAARSTAPPSAARSTVPPRAARRVAPRGAPARTTPVRPELRLVAPATTASTSAARTSTGPVTRRRSRPDEARRRAPFVLLIVALLVGTTLGLLVLNTAIAVDSLEATRLQAENAQRAQEVQRLEQRVVAGGAPAQIASAAVAAGLVPAGPAAYLVIEPDGTVVLRGTPQPAPAPESPGGD